MSCSVLIRIVTGMHSIKEKPVVVNGQIVIRPIMVVALTYDHRLLDGREAVTFLGMSHTSPITWSHADSSLQSRYAITSKILARCSLHEHEREDVDRLLSLSLVVSVSITYWFWQAVVSKVS